MMREQYKCLQKKGKNENIDRFIDIDAYFEEEVIIIYILQNYV